jgi:hypothetical protein
MRVSRRSAERIGSGFAEGSLDLFAPICLFALELSGELALFRHFGARGLFGFVGGFAAEGLEAVEVAGGLTDGALDAIDHAADTVEGAGDAFEIFGIGPEFSFSVQKAIQTPGTGGELVDVLALDDVEGAPDVLQLCGESVEFGGIFAGNDEGLGVDPIFQGVQANGVAAFGRGRPGGALRISAIGFDLKS